MKTVLIIEDDEVLAKILSDTLSKAGFSVTNAIDASQGQQAAWQIKPNLIVLDLMLPAGHGIDVLKNIRVSTQTQNIPVIVMTSYEDPSIQDEINSIGVQGFFKKPFKPEEMLIKIKQLIG
jgi:two-component system alkaline phosphatase synthesis response regulator PhoP